MYVVRVEVDKKGNKSKRPWRERKKKKKELSSAREGRVPKDKRALGK